jgi:very-short-patch-repair endonuclease
MRASFAKAAEIAAVQNGRITTRQLRSDCDFQNSGIERAIQAGKLHRVHQGVYAVGHLAPSRLGDWHAAVLACGPEAALSHRCTATLMRVRDGVGPRIDVTIPPGSHRSRPGIEIHRSPLEPWERGTWSNIPVTSPARTVVDVAHEIKDDDAIEWMVRELQFRRLYDRQLLELANRRRPNRTVNRLLDHMPHTRSPLEVAFLNRVVRRHSLAAPECQARLEGFRVDFFWPAARLVVEVDGKDHDLPMMRLADDARDRVLSAAGFVVLRFRWAHIHSHDAATAKQIRSTLANDTPSW